jgi:hypothetical protein
MMSTITTYVLPSCGRIGNYAVVYILLLYCAEDFYVRSKQTPCGTELRYIQRKFPPGETEVALFTLPETICICRPDSSGSFCLSSVCGARILSPGKQGFAYRFQYIGEKADQKFPMSEYSNTVHSIAQKIRRSSLGFRQSQFIAVSSVFSRFTYCM